jgi:predicted RNA polymerase sigma factor
VPRHHPQKLGKREEAKQSYKAYLELAPNSANVEKVKKALAELK